MSPEEELLKLEKEFAEAVVKNDPEAIGRFVTDDWIIINGDGGIIDKERFLGVIKSGALTHEAMESDDIRVRIYGESAVVTGLVRSKGKIHGTRLQYTGAGDGCLCEGRWTMAVRIVTAHWIYETVKPITRET